MVKLNITLPEFLLYFLLIPSILIVLFLLPHEITDFFKLILNNPDIPSIFFSNYLHQDLSHLIGNLGVYFLLIILIFRFEKNKKELYLFSIFSLFLYPFLIYFIIKISFSLSGINNFPPSLGFSGIVSLFNGYFLYTIYKYLKVRINQNLKLRFILILFIINIVAWLVFNKYNLLLLGLSLIVLIFLIASNIKDIQEIIYFLSISLFRFKERRVSGIRLWNFIFCFLSIIPLISLISLLPENLISKAGLVNTPVHFFSFLIGVFIPYLYEFIKIKRIK